MKTTKTMLSILMMGGALSLLAQDMDHNAEVNKEYLRTHRGAHNPPPIHREDDGHWTAWAPPATPEGADVYVVKSGDTLWDLAGAKLGDPYMWPQIWEMNTYIEDAHWIYPGDPLVIVMPNVLTDGMTGSEDELTLGALQVPPIYEWDMHCTGFIRAGWQYPSLQISSHREFARKVYGEHDLVYLNQGTEQGVQAGDEYFVVDKGNPVSGVDTDVLIGNVYTRRGRIKVLVALEKASIGQIVQSCDVMSAGMGLIPFEPIPIPFNVTRTESLPVYVAPNGKSVGRIVYGFDNNNTLGEHQVVYINMGSDHELFPGDRLLVFREDPMGDSYVENYWDLFRQEDASTPDKDLFRYDNQGPVRSGWHGNAVGRTAPDQSRYHGDSRLPSYVNESGASTRTAPDQSAYHGDSRLPAHVQGTTTGSYYGMYVGDFPRKVFAEIVVLSTEDHTAACRVIFSESEVLKGDFVEIQ